MKRGVNDGVRGRASVGVSSAACVARMLQASSKGSTVTTLEYVRGFRCSLNSNCDCLAELQVTAAQQSILTADIDEGSHS